MYYVPLNHEHFPNTPNGYHPNSLPLRNHETFIEQAIEVQTTSTSTAPEQLATKYGIKDVPLFTALTSLSFRISFPYDFMHLIWSNLIPNLLLL